MPRRRGLVRTAGRAAVISGAMTAASGRVARNQHKKFARQDAAQHQTIPRRQASDDEPDVGNAHPGDIAASLQLLAQMRAAGTLSEKEFIAAKRKLLA